MSVDANGNVARLPIQLYFTNIMIAMNCMGRMPYKINVVNYTVDNMDPDMKAKMESTYTGHLLARTRDPITQTCVIQTLLVAVSAAEKKVINTRNSISSKTTQLLIATVPGYTSAVDSAMTPAHKSVAERTIQSNIPIPPFEWEMGKCVVCGSIAHRYKKEKDIICPHADRPNAKENARDNFAKMRYGDEGGMGTKPHLERRHGRNRNGKRWARKQSGILRTRFLPTQRTAMILTSTSLRPRKRMTTRRNHRPRKHAM